MALEYSPRVRAERLISAGRVALALVCLVALWVDPLTPARYVETAHAVLGAYAAYAVLLLLLVWHLPSSWRGPVPVLTHGLDLAAFTLIIYFTEGPTSPFFAYFTFSMLCATLRWQWRGTLWTAAAALALFIGIGLYGAEILRLPAFDLHSFLMRSVYLAVVAVLLTYLGAYQHRLLGDVSRLASWPRGVPDEGPRLVEEILERVTRILGAPRVLMVWEEPEEPWIHTALWTMGKFHMKRDPPTACRPPVAEPLADTDFLCEDAGAPTPTVLHTSPAGFRRWCGAALDPELRTRFAIRTVLSLRVTGESLQGRLFVLDKPGMTSDDLLLGEVAATQVAGSMDHASLLQRLKQAAAVEERLRLARDLHDGVLQSLTGAALQLETVRRLLKEQPQAAHERLQEVQRVIAAEQHDLRMFIRQLKPTAPPLETGACLAARLEELGKRIERQWGMRVELGMDGVEKEIPERLTHEVYHIVHEALINAARHAGASLTRVDLGAQDTRARIIVTDNGHGFPFRGCYDLPALTAMGVGPASLKERIAFLRGAMTIDSTEAGARLDIALPFQPPGV